MSENNPLLPPRLPRVARVISDSKVIMNRGSSSGVRVGQNYLVYGLGASVIDPETKEDLGRVELVRGRVRVTHVQESLATLESTDQIVRKVRRNKSNALSPVAMALAGPWNASGPETEEEYLDKPLDDPEVGDFCRQI